MLFENLVFNTTGCTIAKPIFDSYYEKAGSKQPIFKDINTYIGIQITIVHSVSLFIQVQPRCLENLGYNSTNNLTVPDDWPKRGVM